MLNYIVERPSVGWLWYMVAVMTSRSESGFSCHVSFITLMKEGEHSVDQSAYSDNARVAELTCLLRSVKPPKNGSASSGGASTPKIFVQIIAGSATSPTAAMRKGKVARTKKRLQRCRRTDKTCARRLTEKRDRRLESKAEDSIVEDGRGLTGCVAGMHA